MYSSEKNVQILIALMKKHNIKKIVVSPGSANASFVASVQNDDYFELYSCVDERSAAYMACGMAEEAEEPVAICCTGATASRNYLPGLTEAFYRKLPVLAITATRRTSLIGHNVDQVIDRSNIQNDVAKISVTLPIVNNDDDKWECEVKTNQALLELDRNGDKGPVHINLTTAYSIDFSVKSLPTVKTIHRYFSTYDVIIPTGAKVGVFVGSHSKWDIALTEAVDLFCEKYNAVVLCDQTSNYNGKYGIYVGLLNLCGNDSQKFMNFDYLIHIGNISATWPTHAREIWRVNPDGEIRDTYKKLTKIFEMSEKEFFKKLASNNTEVGNTYYTTWKKEYEQVKSKLVLSSKDLPFSSMWIALKIHSLIPRNSEMHYGILNSLRCWSCFNLDDTISGYSNVGGFGIDGGVSSLLGAALVNPNKLYFGIFGDLAFFYDMNSIGNRQTPNNIRLMVVNNGLGGEFKTPFINVQRAGLGNSANKYIAAEGHYGHKSKELLKHYAEDLGFDYISASNKNEFDLNYKRFLDEQISQSMVFEIFVDEHHDSDALRYIQNLYVSTKEQTVVDTTKKIAKNILGEKGISSIKKLIRG